MAYYNGSANSLIALRSALLDACTLEGWAWNGDKEVLSKGALFLQVTIGADGIFVLGRTSLEAGNAPSAVRVGRVFSRSGYPTYDVTYPASYELFVFEQEVFFVINYDVEYYQWLCFGAGTVDGLPGTGMWLGASLAATVVGAVGSRKANPIYMTPTGGGDIGNNSAVAPALCWAQSSAYDTAQNWWVHSDLDGHGWYRSSNGTDRDDIGIGPTETLLSVLPSQWNDESVLVPIRAYKERPEYYISLVADIANARHIRIDNYEPGQVLIVGDESWKVFPWFRKNAAARDGGYAIDHSGTYGWAIRYEGA